MTPTVRDLYSRISSDPTLTPEQRSAELARLTAAVGNPSSSAPVDSFMPVLIGVGLGAAVARYFGAGALGTLLGGALGGAIGNKPARSTDPYAGYIRF